MLEESINISHNHKLVKLIALWMFLVSYPWVHFFYSQRAFMPQSFLEILAILGIATVFFCALGLILTKEMARMWSIWLFALYFFWSYYLVCFNIAPFFSSSTTWLSSIYHIPVATVKGMILVLLVTHMMWPVIVVMYLTNPNVKTMFH